MTRPIVELCIHGEAKPHDFIVKPGTMDTCPGGRVLEQAIIIERDTDGNWPDFVYDHPLLNALASAQEQT